MQDAFLKAWRALPRFKGDAAFATWLYRVAVNTCLSRLSARRPTPDALAQAAVVADPRENQAQGCFSANRRPPYAGPWTSYPIASVPR